MRITDNMLTNTFLNNFATTKAQMQDIQTQLATNSKLNKPSDNPSGTARALRLSSQISDNDVYSSNIATGKAALNSTTSAMDTMNDEINKVLVAFTNLQNPVNSTQASAYADTIDNSITALLNAANTEQDGKYLFGGTDFLSKPFDYSSDNKTVQVKSSDISGDLYVKTSQNITQKINISGAELFSTKVSMSGSIDSTKTDAQQSTTTVYDSRGNQYNLNVSYTKTADNTYDMQYDVVDSGGTSVYSNKSSVKFDANNGGIQSVDGKDPSGISINVSGKDLYFVLDPTSVTEKSGTSNVSYSANQKTDIFNTLIKIRDNLKAGTTPSTDDIQAVKDFSARLLKVDAQAGNYINTMENTDDLLTSQGVELNTLLSKEKDVDVAQAVMDLQNKNYLMQMSYKISSMVLPKSLVDFL